MRKLILGGILALLFTGLSYSKEPYVPIEYPSDLFSQVIVTFPPKEVSIKPTFILTPTFTPTTAPKRISTTKSISWNYDKEVSWYGPGFYGNKTACGQRYTTAIMGVAHRTLPCGTLVAFKWGGKEITVPVIDRGPYVKGRIWDLSGGLCTYLNHCFTGPIYYRILR